MITDWERIFDECYPEPGARPEVLRSLHLQVGAALTAAELAEYSERWHLPSGPLPPSYLRLLAWSDGGEFRTGKRWFQFFAARELREMTLAYALPEHMPNALPFALNGSGTFYLFDMRALPSAGEYPIVCSAAGNTGWGTDECALIAERFLDACMGTRCVDEILRELT